MVSSGVPETELRRGSYKESVLRRRLNFEYQRKFGAQEIRKYLKKNILKK